MHRDHKVSTEYNLCVSSANFNYHFIWIYIFSNYLIKSPDTKESFRTEM